MELPEKEREEYEKMRNDLAHFASSLDMDLNEMYEEAGKYAKRYEDDDKKNDEYDEELKMVRIIYSMAESVTRKTDQLIRDGLYRIEMNDIRVGYDGILYDRRICRPKEIHMLCRKTIVSRLFQR